MLKRVLCLLLVILLVLCPFALTAYADVDVSLIEYLTTWMFTTSYDLGYGGMSADDIIDFYNTEEGQLYMKSFYRLGAPLGTFIINDSVEDANEGRYMTAAVTSAQLEEMYNQLNGFWSNDNAEVRNYSLADFGLVAYGDNTISSSWGYLSGTGKCIAYGSDSYMSFNPGTIDTSKVHVYNGSIYYPPVLYVSNTNMLYQDGVALPVGFYYVLNTTELLYCGYTSTSSAMYLRYTTGETLDDVTVNYYRPKIGTPKIYKSGVAYSVNVSGDEGYDGYDVLSKITDSVGLHIVFDESDTGVIPVPEDIPYEDDTVYVMVPIDSPGKVVYMSPTEYNTYINNGDIISDDDTTNNIVSSEQVNNLYDCYNTYITNNYNGSSYDDSNLLDKLAGWFGDVNDNLDKIVDRLDTIINYIDSLSTEPVYASFSDCLTDNIPLANSIQTALEDISVNEIGEPLSIEYTFKEIFGIESFDVVIDLEFYEPYRLRIRNLLVYLCYIIAIGCSWHSVRSVFGIHISAHAFSIDVDPDNE